MWCLGEKRAWEGGQRAWRAFFFFPGQFDSQGIPQLLKLLGAQMPQIQRVCTGYSVSRITAPSTITQRYNR